MVLGPPSPERLPPRVLERLAEQQRTSEILVGWVQMLLVSLFGTLYALAPKTAPIDAPFEPVPVTLSVYAVFTILRLALAYRNKLRPWFLCLSIVIDISVLLITIWSFHLQYQQPPAFYLKAPTMLYLFIMIALRALRFQASYVVLTGILAALGWAGLIVYAVMESPDSMPLTRSYTEYVMSYHVLLGAEVDKIASLLAVTAVIAIAIVRARRLLVRSIAEEAAVAEMSRFFDVEVAKRIRALDQDIQPGRGEIRHAAVMYVDLRGYSVLTRDLSPDGQIELLGEYQRLVAPLIRQGMGTIERFLGDGIMAHFGAVDPSNTYAADALRTSDAIFLAASKWVKDRRASGLPAPDIAIAIAVGPVIFGIVGLEDRLEFTVIGDAANTAAKLEKHTKAEGVRGLATAQTLDTALGQGYVSPWTKRRLPGCVVEGQSGSTDLIVLDPPAL